PMMASYKPGASQQDYSEKTGQSIDEEVKDLVDTNYNIAMDILKENRDALDRIAEALILWETLDWAQVEKLVSGEEIGVPIIEEIPKKEEDKEVSNNEGQEGQTKLDNTKDDGEADDPLLA
ncbi:MAG: hypothetical protein OEY33_06820, partial [Bdellovibrionales bacterium]|nr:hypothetical protein [Bdellovibrionales bacterium]